MDHIWTSTITMKTQLQKHSRYRKNQKPVLATHDVSHFITITLPPRDSPITSPSKHGLHLDLHDHDETTIHHSSLPSPFQPMETPTRHSFEQATTRESPLRKFSWYKLKTAGIFLFNRNITPKPSIQPRPGDPTFPHPGIQPASTARSQKCRKGSRRDSGIGPSLHEERSPHFPNRGITKKKKKNKKKAKQWAQH